MEPVRLQPWEEGIGTLRKICDEGPYKILDFGRFRLRLDEAEITALGDVLSQKVIGKRISILRTDLPNKPMILREHG